MNKFSQAIKVIFGICAALLFLGFGIGSSKPMQPNALLLVDLVSRKYYSFPCVANMPNLRVVIFDKSKTDDREEQTANFSQRKIVEDLDAGISFALEAGDSPKLILAPMRPATMYKLESTTGKFSPDEHCRDQNGFMQDGRSASGMFLERIGILGPIKSRWNQDGTWNW